jgi:hypothetical protein
VISWRSSTFLTSRLANRTFVSARCADHFSRHNRGELALSTRDMAEADSASIPEGGNVIAHIAISQRLLAAPREPGSQVSASRVEGSLPSGPKRDSPARRGRLTAVRLRSGGCR